jgi:hypothetical protein
MLLPQNACVKLELHCQKKKEVEFCNIMLMYLANVTHNFSVFAIRKSETFCSTMQQTADKISFLISFVFLFHTPSKIQTDNLLMYRASVFRGFHHCIFMQRVPWIKRFGKQ